MTPREIIPADIPEDAEREVYGALAQMVADERRYAGSPWRPIATAPRDGEWVIVHGFWYPKGDYSGITLGAYLPYEEMWTFEGDLMDRPTHWMPLPKPPEI